MLIEHLGIRFQGAILYKGPDALPRTLHMKFSARFRKISLRRVSRPLRRGDADGLRLRRASEWAVKQAFASRAFQNRGRQNDAASGFHFGDNRTGAVAFHCDERFGGNEGEHALENAVILGVVLAAENHERLGSYLFQ